MTGPTLATSWTIGVPSGRWVRGAMSRQRHHDELALQQDAGCGMVSSGCVQLFLAKEQNVQTRSVRGPLLHFADTPEAVLSAEQIAEKLDEESAVVI